jgi:hypothetical protein
MFVESVHNATGVESSLNEAGGRHGSESSKKVCASNLLLRSKHRQILQCRL